MLPGGIDEYLSMRAAADQPTQKRAASDRTTSVKGPGAASRTASPAAPAQSDGGQGWRARKELDRLERRIHKLAERAAELHAELAAHAADYEKLLELGGELQSVEAERAQAEDEWLLLAADLDG
jgi:ATP-binding cassette subfamily F protein uup